MSSRGGYSQVHHSGPARPNGVDGDDGEFGSVEEDGDIFIYPRSVTQESWKRREGVARRSCISIIIP